VPAADVHRADLDQRLQTLRTLAHQSHLLALNAAVMAARSGSAGQPPAPAAQAIQHLAAQVSRQLGATTSEIAAMVDGQAPGRAGVATAPGQGGE
jgi:methyl-accepting chemotaxis protein